MINLWDVTVGMIWTGGKIKSVKIFKGLNYFFSSLRINIINIIPVYIEHACYNYYAVPQMKCAIMRLVYTVSSSWMYRVLYDTEYEFKETNVKYPLLHYIILMYCRIV
jgi:hypothetical protein